MPIMSGQTFTELPPFLQQPYRTMVEGAERYGAAPYQQYQDERIAEIPEELQMAHDLARAGLGEEMPMLQEAGNQARRAFEPFYQNAEQYMNPYNRNVVSQIAEEGNRNFNENVLPALEARFIRLGQHGSTKHRDLSLRAARDLQHEILNRQQQALASGYQQAGQMYNAQQARQIEGAGQLGSLAGSRQGARFGDIAGLENVGRYRQQQQQASNDIRYQNWLREQEHPMYRMQQQAGIMQGVPSQGINQSYYQTPATPAMNIPGQFGQMAGQFLGARMAMGR